MVDMFRDALYDRSLSVAQLDSLLLLLFQLQTPEADLQSNYLACFQQEVLELLHKHETLAHDLAQYMQALDVALEALPYFEPERRSFKNRVELWSCTTCSKVLGSPALSVAI